MFKKIIAIAAVAGATLAFQAPAQADVKIGFYTTPHVVHYDGGHRHSYHGRKHYKGHKHHKGHGYKSRLSNGELRYLLREQGYRKIRFVNRGRGVAKFNVISPRGHLGRVAISTRNGRILDRRILRRADYGYRGHKRPYRGHSGFKGGFVINF